MSRIGQDRTGQDRTISNDSIYFADQLYCVEYFTMLFILYSPTQIGNNITLN
jgi:hypothetical protein